MANIYRNPGTRVGYSDTTYPTSTTTLPGRAGIAGDVAPITGSRPDQDQMRSIGTVRRVQEQARRHRVRRAVAGAALTAVAATGAVAGVAINNRVSSDNARNRLTNQLQQPLRTVEQEVKTGKIDTASISIVPATESGNIDAVIPDMIGSSANPGPLEAIADKQSDGTHEIAKGTPIIARAGEFPSTLPTEPASSLPNQK